MLQGSYFLLLVHLSLAKSVLLELFYHIEGIQRAGGDKPRPCKSMWKRRIELTLLFPLQYGGSALTATNAGSG
jgi:hypothetical protein